MMKRRYALVLVLLGCMVGNTFAQRKNHIKTRPRPAKKKEQSHPAKKAKKKSLAEWTIVTYIQADNNLDTFAYHNINDMQTVALPDNVNMLVQWDQPNNNRTWRYKIVEGGRIEDASLTTEMGINPKQELIDMAQWTKDSYPAKHYAIILWNHGAGIIDYKSQKMGAGVSLNLLPRLAQFRVPWLEIPGLKMQKERVSLKDRGILYDDSQHTFMNNQDLAAAFATISNQVYGKKVDLVGMDACLMGMLEVGYQIRNYADYFVASQELEPGDGWSYSGFLNPLCLDPAGCDARTLASHIVQGYGDYYRPQIDDYTQSAVQLDCLDKIKKNVDRMIYFVNKCKESDSWKIRNIIQRARRDAVVFEDDYIDLHSFYHNMFKLSRIRRTPDCLIDSELVDNDREIELEIAALEDFTPAEERELEREMKLRGFRAKRISYVKATKKLRQVLASGMKSIRAAVSANVTGHMYRKAKGISIYYPRGGKLHNSYYRTNFALDSQWTNFIQEYQ